MKSPYSLAINCLGLLFCYLFVGCEPPSNSAPAAESKRASETKPDRMSGLEASIKQIWRDAKVGSDAEYGSLFRMDPHSEVVAPSDMRKLINAWKGRKGLRRWPGELQFSFFDERIRFRWTAELANESTCTEALQRFDDAMEQRGFRVLDTAKAVETLGKRLGLTAKEIDNWAHSQKYHGYTRTVNGTEIAAMAEAIAYDGGRHFQSGVNSAWFAVRPFAHPRPTLKQALNALPAWFRISYLKPSFYEALADCKIDGCSAGHGTTIDFHDNVYDKIVQTLEVNSFDFYKEYDPLPNGGIQKTWKRYADTTYAHIITFPGSEQTRFSCQAPQNKGKPKTVKTPLHPSLRLPLSKRPVLELKQLTFADPKLKAKIQFFHNLAGKIAGTDWFVQRYKDMRYSPAPHYGGTWQSTEVRSSYFLKRVLPYRSISMVLDGPKAAKGKEPITTARVSGRWVPKTGWAASVSFSLSPSPAAGEAIVKLVRDHHSQFSFNDYSGSNSIHLVRTYASASVRKANSDFSYSYQVQLPFDKSDQGAANRRRQFLSLFESPKQLRDQLLVNIAELRRTAREQVPNSHGIEVTDWRNVRSDNPPRPAPPDFDRPLPKEIREELLGQILKRLDSIEQTIQENHQQIHAAIYKALPLDESQFPWQDDHEGKRNK